jgi:hypothetical protein
MSSFSVCQFFPSGAYEYVRQNVGTEEAVFAFKHYTTSVGARLGTTARVIITDEDDAVAMEWVFEKGIVFPPELAGPSC